MMYKILFLFMLFFSHFSGLFSQNLNYYEADNLAMNLPVNLTFNLDTLSKYLTKDFSSETYKVRSIYTWVTKNIYYDLNALEEGKSSYTDPADVLRNGYALCAGYSNLFDVLCKSAGIKSYIIEGYDKGFGYYPGKKFLRSEHCWNAVQIDKKWQLIDPTWSNGYLERIKKISLVNKILGKVEIKSKLKYHEELNEKYFCSSPGTFVADHLPANPDWQLLNCPVQIDVFENGTTSIDSFLTKKKLCNTYNYNDSIKLLKETFAVNSQLLPANRAFQFNHENYRIIGTAYFTTGDKMYESAGNYGNDIQIGINRYKEILDFLQKSKAYFLLEKQQIKDEHKYLSGKYKTKQKNSAKENNSCIRQNQKILKDIDNYLNKASQRKNELNNNIKQLSVQNEILNADDKITDVNRPKNQSDTTAIRMIGEYELNIKQNTEKINKIRNEVMVDCTSTNDSIYKVLINNSLTINQQVLKCSSLLDTNILYISQFDPFLYQSILKNKTIFKNYHILNDQLRKINAYNEKIIAKQNFKDLKNQYSQLFSLTKENKKLLISIKKLNSDDNQEDSRYVSENVDVTDDIEKMIQNHKNAIYELNLTLPLLKDEYKAVEQESKNIDNSKKYEDAYWAEFIKSEKASFQMNKNINSSSSKQCNSLISKCIQLLKKLEADTQQKK